MLVYQQPAQVMCAAFLLVAHNHSDSSMRHQAATGIMQRSAQQARQHQASIYTFSIASAVLTGTVDFSMTILLVLETLAIIRAAPSQYVRSAALPAPTPRVLVGVLTLQTKSTLSKTNPQPDPAGQPQITSLKLCFWGVARLEGGTLSAAT